MRSRIVVTGLGAVTPVGTGAGGVRRVVGGVAAASRPVVARRALATALGWDGHCCAVVFGEA